MRDVKELGPLVTGYSASSVRILRGFRGSVTKSQRLDSALGTLTNSGLGSATAFKGCWGGREPCHVAEGLGPTKQANCNSGDFNRGGADWVTVKL